MSTFKNISILLIVTSIFACSETKIQSSKTKGESVLIATPDIYSNDTSPHVSVIGFLKWYKNNEERLHEIHLLKGGLKDTTTYYSVDFKATESYLAELKKSGYLSDKFLDGLREHFNKSNESLKEHPQNDGPAPGFEADLIMKAQDYMDVWGSLDKVKVIDEKVDRDKAFIILLFADYYDTRYYLTKTRNRWLIDDIDNAVSED